MRRRREEGYIEGTGRIQWGYSESTVGYSEDKKGISLTLMRWKNWVDYLEYADQARTEKQNYKSHLGGNIYCTITEGSACMDIRQYWKPQEEVIPTKKGLYLRPLEYIAVKELLTEIGRVLPELDGVVPCYVQSDHMNQHLLNVRDGYAERDSQGHYIVGSGRKYRELKEMRQKEKPVVNLVTPVAQALEMAKSELKRKGEDSITDRGRKTATSDWNSLRY